ncbi:hypothetical protein [Lacipirellula parvula]|uniref:Uncharacterized protein n=1 Tax=Lacipirellula parvula TaxID=2650471 RepID=A0A5K7XRB1_9BACT|nr:hypothetical protein [Lacipirellula parvula]BBO36429.1 hypothetical protein PLANPX_6041 [Lacipirellula parvula]
MDAVLIIHVIISLLGIVSGYIVIGGMLQAQRLPRWTAFFLVTTVLTSATGFLFPFVKLLPSHILAVLSLIILPISIYALYGKKLVGRWRATYVITAIVAQYLNVFVLIFQAFQKLPPLHALAPTQSEPPFAVAQGVNLLAFIALGYLATKKFHPTAS